MSDDVRFAKVAIIGSGLAGLTSAHLLATAAGNSKTHFEVHLFEKASEFGMDSRSISVPSPQTGLKSDLRVDVPMRSFQGGYYPFLIALYTHLGVAFRAANFSYSFSHLLSASPNGVSSPLQPWLLYNGRSGLGGISAPSQDWATNISLTFNSLHPPPFLLRFSDLILPILFAFAMLFNFVRLAILSCPVFYSKDDVESFGDWTLRNQPSGRIARWMKIDLLWLEFIHKIVQPLFSSVCTAPEEDIYQHPAPEILEYIWRTHFTSHYVVMNGVQDVVVRLTKVLQPTNIHLSSTITSMRDDPQRPSTVEIIFEQWTPSSGTHSTQSIPGFHHVIFATQANSAARILETYRSSLNPESIRQEAVDAQIQCLQTFKYVPNTVINHTDDRFLPIGERDQRDLNFVNVPLEAAPDFQQSTQDPLNGNATSFCLPPSYTMATQIIRSPTNHGINGPNHPSSVKVYQTTNPILPPHESTILSIVRLERAVLTPRSKLAQRDLMIEETEPLVSWNGCPVHPPVLGIKLKLNTRDWPFVFSRKRRRRLGRLQGIGKLPVQSLSLQRGGTEKSLSRESDDTRTPAGIWFCGSYAHPGIPLLEACVTSALNVVENGIFKVEGVEARIDWLP